MMMALRQLHYGLARARDLDIEIATAPRDKSIVLELKSELAERRLRIGFVYTPKEERGKGYASACVAAASEKALETGYKFCCLFTDLGNPTSNSIYQRIGYNPVTDVLDYDIAPL